MADQAKGKGIAPKRASNLADLGQSSRPLLPIRTLLEDKEDSEDYSEVIEVLKHVSAIKNISSTLAFLTNSSNAIATTTGKTSYSPRFDPFSGTIDLDSPLRPPRKEPHLGPAVNSATSNLDPPRDTGSKEGFKDTITSSIVKELSKKAFTIPDDSKLSGESNFEQWIQALSIVLRALGISNFLENPNISNTYSNSDQAILLMLLRDSLSSSPRAAISRIHIPSKAFKLLIRQYSRPIESKKEDVYNEFHALTFSTYRKGLSAFNAEFNGYLTKLTIAKIDIDPSLILNQNPAIEAYRAAHVANSSNSTLNSNSNPSKKGKNKKKGKKKASYNVEGQNYSAKSAEQASFMLGSYNLAIEEEEESNSSSNSSSSSDSNTQLVQLLALKGYKKRKDFKGKGLKTSSNNKAKYKDNQPRRRPKDPDLYNSWLYDTGSTDHISNSKERKEDSRPIIEDAIVSEVIEPNKRYKLRNSPAKGTILEGIGPSLRGKRPFIEGNEVEKAISSPTLKEPNIGYIGLRLLKKTSSFTKGLPKFDKIKEADFHRSSCDRGKAVRRVSKALIPDPPRVLDLIEGDTIKIRPRPYNRNPIVLLLVDCKSRYRWVFNLPNKLGPIVANAIKGFFRGLRNGFGRYPTKFHFDGGTEIADLLTTLLAKRGIKFSTSAPYIYEQNSLVERSVRVILDLNSTAITNKETTPFQALFDELEPGILYIPNLERYRAIGAKGEAIIPLEKRSQSLKFTFRTEECKLLAVLGSKTYLVYILSRRAVLKTSTVKFIEDNTVLSQPTDNTALEGELVDLDLDLEWAVSLDPSNLNTEKPISIEIGPSKLEPYESSSDSELDEPSPDKPINPVIVESTRPTISIRKPELPEAFP
ncbi:hypothetical protein P8C59_008231 [Phyllachora maydis]|uniref:Integrase catalytic domain-containing protein n=1 Tax=Phyllachora maydis TaxID=1825666 RepID=A0AAD9MEC9_9PEZI|nr:hypothetical protein P8C59_008231 [Phyllachora maydis]